MGDPIVYDGVNVGLLRVGFGPDRSEAEVERIIAEVSGGKLYGAAFFRESGYGNFMFQERFRNEGGKFFDADTMKAIHKVTKEIPYPMG